jgi:hypothetical protein
MTGTRPANCPLCSAVAYTALNPPLGIEGKTPKVTAPAESDASAHPSEVLQEHNSNPFLSDNASSASFPKSRLSDGAPAATTANGVSTNAVMPHHDTGKSLASQTTRHELAIGTVHFGLTDFRHSYHAYQVVTGRASSRKIPTISNSLDGMFRRRLSQQPNSLQTCRNIPSVSV